MTQGSTMRSEDVSQTIRYSVAREAPIFCVEDNSIVRTKIMTRVYELSKERPLSLLDSGCGACAMWPVFLDHVKNITFYGVDLNEKSVAMARSKLPRFAENIRVGRGEDVPELFDNKFDVIVSRAVLEHVYYRARFIESLCNCLRNGGILIMTYGSQHFKEGLRTSLRNVLSGALAFVGLDKYYAKSVNETNVEEILKKKSMKVVEKKYLSLIQVKMAHKLLLSTIERKRAALLWLELEERLNESASDKERLRRLTDETYLEIRHAD